MAFHPKKNQQFIRSFKIFFLPDGKCMKLRRKEKSSRRGDLSHFQVHLVCRRFDFEILC